MTNRPQINEAAIRAKVTEQSYDRGVDYYHSGAVESATMRGSQLFAVVQGSEWDPYRVGVTFVGSDDDSPIPIGVKSPIADLLDPLDAESLRALIHQLVEANPALAEVVDEFCGTESP